MQQAQSFLKQEQGSSQMYFANISSLSIIFIWYWLYYELTFFLIYENWNHSDVKEIQRGEQNQNNLP